MTLLQCKDSIPCLLSAARLSCHKNTHNLIIVAIHSSLWHSMDNAQESALFWFVHWWICDCWLKLLFIVRIFLIISDWYFFKLEFLWKPFLTVNSALIQIVSLNVPFVKFSQLSSDNWRQCTLHLANLYLENWVTHLYVLHFQRWFYFRPLPTSLSLSSPSK